MTTFCLPHREQIRDRRRRSDEAARKLSIAAWLPSICRSPFDPHPSSCVTFDNLLFATFCVWKPMSKVPGVVKSKFKLEVENKLKSRQCCNNLLLDIKRIETNPNTLLKNHLKLLFSPSRSAFVRDTRRAKSNFFRPFCCYHHLRPWQT
jgi:hypothetical protein